MEKGMEKERPTSMTKSPADLDEASPKETTIGLELPEDGSDPSYAAKAQVLNDAIQSIGMGRYQWHLFFLIGFGWGRGSPRRVSFDIFADRT